MTGKHGRRNSRQKTLPINQKAEAHCFGFFSCAVAFVAGGTFINVVHCFRGDFASHRPKYPSTRTASGTDSPRGRVRQRINIWGINDRFTSRCCPQSASMEAPLIEKFAINSRFAQINVIEL